MREGSAVLVAQHFLPLNVVSAQRALRMARALLKRYERLYVVSGDTSSMDESFLDREYGRDVLADPRLVCLPVHAILKRYGYGTTGSPVQRLIGGVATRLFCGPGVDWIPGLRRALASVPAGERIRVAVATGPPFVTFGTVVRWARARQVPVMLDYRDLWTGNPHARYPRVARAAVRLLLEEPLNRRASVVTTVSDGCREMLEMRGRTKPVRVLYNSPDREYLAHYRRLVDECGPDVATSGEADGGSLRLVYTGQLYPGCTFAPLLQAMAGLPAHRQGLISIHYYGGSSSLARHECHRFGLSGRLVDHGKVSKDDALRAVIGADLLLSLIHTDRVSASPAVTGLMTTKLYDYLLSGNPILNIGPVNAEAVGFAARMRYRAFHTFTADDLDGLRNFLNLAVTDAAAMKTALVSVPLPDFEADLNAILDDALADRAGKRA